MTRRTCAFPVFVIPRLRIELPLECSLGTSAQYAINCLGLSNRLSCPSSVTTVVAVTFAAQRLQ